jgi:hypothetical protein
LAAAKSKPWTNQDELKALDKACNQKFVLGTKVRNRPPFETDALSLLASLRD